MSKDTLRENFWKGEFGNEYTDRNRGQTVRKPALI